MTTVDEIAPDVFRLSIYVPDFDMQFNHFLVRDEEPLLFHAGLKSMFPLLREAVAKLVNPARLRHIAWSHFESDEWEVSMTGCSLRPMPNRSAPSLASL
jgi:flavorubredoxin